MKPEDDMNIILVGKRHGKSRTVSVNAPVLAGAVLFVTALLVLAGWSGYKAVSSTSLALPTILVSVRSSIAELCLR